MVGEIISFFFLLYKILFVRFFYLKLTLYDCEVVVLFISVKPIVNKKKQ